MIKVHIEDAEGMTGTGRWFDEHLQNGLTGKFNEFTYAGIRVRVRQIENDLTDTTITIRPVNSASDDGENEDEGETFSGESEPEPNPSGVHDECLLTLYRMINKRLAFIESSATPGETCGDILAGVERLAAVIATLQKA